MWNRLVVPLINNREGIEVGGEGKSANAENVWRDWLSAADLTVDGGVAFGL